MPYDVAIAKSWEELENLTKQKNHAVRFLADEYNINIDNQQILSLSCNIPTKEYLSILLLHYLSRKLKGLPAMSGEWVSFAQLPGGQGYLPVFKKRVVTRILKKYAVAPESLLELSRRFKAEKGQIADFSVVLEVFDQVPVLITLWRGDEEFAPEANIHYDQNIRDIFCTEDIVVMSEFVAAKI